MDRLKVDSCGYAAAIWKLYPNSEFSISNNDMETLSWSNGNDFLPDIDLIEKTQKQLEIEYENNEYQRLRALKYPSIKDQLDVLYHGGYDSWKEEINKVKEEYPKPE